MLFNHGLKRWNSKAHFPVYFKLIMSYHKINVTSLKEKQHIINNTNVVQIFKDT